MKRPQHLSAGSHGAVLALGDAKRPWLNLSGFWSWVAWRSAYLTRLGSINNRIYVMLNWLTTILFGHEQVGIYSELAEWGPVKQELHVCRSEQCVPLQVNTSGSRATTADSPGRVVHTRWLSCVRVS